MDDFSAHVKTVQRIAIFFLSFCFMGWAILSAYRPYFAGMVLGIVFSLINARYLVWKIEQLTHAIVEQTKRKVNMGFLTRASISLIAVLIAYKYEQYVALSTTLAGLFFVQLATLLLGIISTLKARK